VDETAIFSVSSLASMYLETSLAMNDEKHKEIDFKEFMEIMKKFTRIRINLHNSFVKM